MKEKGKNNIKTRRPKALPILRKLNSEEFEKFKSFVKSSYFGGSEELSAFIECISDYYPKFDEEKFKNEYLRDSDAKIDKLFTLLYPICKKYLIQLHFEDKGLEKDLALILEYEKRKVNEKDYFDMVKELRLKLTTNQQLDFHNFWLAHILDTSEYDFIMLNREIKNDRAYISAMESQSGSQDPLLCHFFLESLNVMNNYYIRENKVVFDYDKFNFTRNFKKIFPEKVKSYLFAQIKEQIVLPEHRRILEVIEMTHQMLKDKSKIDNLLEQAKALFCRNIEYMSRELAYHLFTDFINIYYRYALNHEERYDEEFEFYSYFLDKKGFQMGNKEKMYFSEVKHLVSRVVSARKYEWADNIFFGKYIEYFPPEHVDMLRSLMEIHRYIDEKLADKKVDENKYLQYFESLSSYKPASFTLERDIRGILSIFLFMSGKYDSCISKLNGLEEFIDKNKNLKKEQAEPFKIFVNYMRELIRIEYSLDKTNNRAEYNTNISLLSKKIFSDIENKTLIFGGSWLKKNIEKMLSKSNNIK